MGSLFDYSIWLCISSSYFPLMKVNWLDRESNLPVNNCMAQNANDNEEIQIISHKEFNFISQLMASLRIDSGNCVLS